MERVTKINKDYRKAYESDPSFLNKALWKLSSYENMEAGLSTIYGNYENLLQVTVDGLLALDEQRVRGFSKKLKDLLEKEKSEENRRLFCKESEELLHFLKSVHVDDKVYLQGLSKQLTVTDIMRFDEIRLFKVIAKSEDEILYCLYLSDFEKTWFLTEEDKEKKENSESSNSKTCEKSVLIEGEEVDDYLAWKDRCKKNPLYKIPVKLNDTVYILFAHRVDGGKLQYERVTAHIREINIRENVNSGVNIEVKAQAEDYSIIALNPGTFRKTWFTSLEEAEKEREIYNH